MYYLKFIFLFFLIERKQVNKLKFRGKAISEFPKTFEKILEYTFQKPNEFKSNCLNDKSILYESSEIQIAEINEQYIKNGSLFNKIIIFFKNKSDVSMKDCSIEYYSENGKNFFFLKVFEKLN